MASKTQLSAEDQTILEGFMPLWDDVAKEEEIVSQYKPLLAHYTSIETLEKILSTNEIWFSNPLLMNDLEEVRFSITEGFRRILENDEIEKACGTEQRLAVFDQSFDDCYTEFANEHALDTYVLCFSEHERTDQDGLLSMWRGYGGNGKGAALVFDTANLERIATSALVLSKVQYGTTEERILWIEDLIRKFAGLLSTVEVPDGKLYLPAYALFQRLKMFALFSKHRGFAEEKEWRVVYVRDRDQDNRLAPMFGYHVGMRGVEPKLKFPIGPVDGMTGSALSLEALVDRIVLGPSVSSPLAKAAFLRMLDRLGRGSLKEDVYASSIPFRVT